MMQRALFSLLAGVLALTAQTPLSAAVTKTAGFDENPRTTWFERFQESRQGPEQTERFAQVYKVGANGALDLQNVSGDIRVTTARGNEIRVEAVKRVRHRDAEEAKRFMSQLRIEVAQVGDRVEIRTMYPRTTVRSISASVDYTVVVPEAAAVAVKGISGDIAVTGVRGEVRAETVSGDVDATSTPNLAFAKTISGAVRARDIASQSNITLGTVSGTVIANGVKVRVLDAGSISGDVHLANLQVERLTAKNVSGNIEYSGALARGGRYEFNAHSGNVRLLLPADTQGFELDASTFSGSVRTDFGVTLRNSTRPNGRGPNRMLRGTYGDAGALLAARSFSGNVVIVKK